MQFNPLMKLSISLSIFVDRSEAGWLTLYASYTYMNVASLKKSIDVHSCSSADDPLVLCMLLVIPCTACPEAQPAAAIVNSPVRVLGCRRLGCSL